MIKQFKANLLPQYIPALLGLALPLSIIISNYLFALVMVLLVFQSSRRTKIAWVPMFIMAIPLLIPMISILLHSELTNLTSLQVRIPFLATALIIGFFKVDYNALKGFKRGLVLGTMLATSLFLLDNAYFQGQIQQLAILDLSYVSLFLVTSLIIIWYTDIEIRHVFKLVISLLLLIALSQCTNAFFMIAGLLIALSAIIVKGAPIQAKFGIFLIVVVSALMMYRGTEINNYLIERNGLNTNKTEKLAQWQCVLEIMQGKEMSGIGYHNKEHALLSCYRSHAMANAETLLLNAHNEYLDFFLTLGYIGVLALLVYFINAMFVAYDYKQVAHLLIMILIALFSLTENVFTRQKGVMLTSITCLLIYAAKDFSHKKETNAAGDDQDDLPAGV